MKYFTLIDSEIDVAPLASQIKANSHLWNKYGYRKQTGSPHTQMSDIWVRYNDCAECLRTGDWSKFNNEHDSIWYPAFYRLPALKTIIFNLMRQVEGERLGGVLITKIPSGGAIAPHVDKGWHVEYYEKYYLSIQSGPGATFHHKSGEFINPKPGDMWLFDNKEEHWVLNQSDEDRITLIICIRRDSGAAAGHFLLD